MASQRELDVCYMKVAYAHAELSKAVRKKVGACLVTASGVVVPGYNGTPKGDDNNCEDSAEGVLVTKPTVIHAELNCIMKCAEEGIVAKGSKLYVTMSPCLPCAALIVQAGISEVLYHELYRDFSSLVYLLNNGVEVLHLDFEM